MYIRWNGVVGAREIRGYTFEPGQIILVEDDDAALDMQTQPGESFEEIGPGHPDYPGNEPAQLRDLEGMALRYIKALKKMDVTELAQLTKLDEVGCEELAGAIGVAVEVMDGWVTEAKRLIQG